MTGVWFRNRSGVFRMAASTVKFIEGSMHSLYVTTCFLLTCLAVVECSHAQTQPNVIVILTDDQGWGDLSLNGNTNLSTPNIDGLARDGASFDRFLSALSVHQPVANFSPAAITLAVASTAPRPAVNA